MADYTKKPHLAPPKNDVIAQILTAARDDASWYLNRRAMPRDLDHNLGAAGLKKAGFATLEICRCGGAPS
jgi:hypothetical protein